MLTIDESLKTPVAGDYDVIVAGGGPAGIGAALGAADAGARVLVIEAAGCLGGVWTAGLLSWVFDISESGIGRELTDRLLKVSGCTFANGEGMRNFSYHAERMKCLLEAMCAERGVDVLLHTRVVSAIAESSSAIHAVATESKSFRQAWTARTFVDCTGEGDLGALAGNAFVMGDAEGVCQPATMMALISVPDVDAVVDQVSFFGGAYNHLEAHKRFAATLKTLGIDTSYGHPTLFHLGGNVLALMINHQYGIDATDALSVTRHTLEARAEINRVADALQAGGTPFRGTQLVSTAEHIGIREGRRLAGEFEVTRDDLLQGRRHDDVICTVRFNIDIHSSDPKKDKGLKTVKVPAYDIPARALKARDVPNLWMAGRCISGDRDAFSSYRITGAAVSMGEAAGRAAALGARVSTPVGTR